MITLDTSGILALVNKPDIDHARTVAAFEAEDPPYIVPCEILSEIGYLLEGRHGQPVLDAFLAQLETGALSVEHDADRVPRIRELADRYSDLPLGFSDAAVVACAEDHGGRVLTLDERDFGVVAREGRLQVVPGE